MRVLITGASGFLGREVVRAAITAGHEVIALVRPTANLQALGWPGDVKVVRGDLRQIGEWAKHLAQIEAVVHLAAATSGDLAAQFSGTVVATENLIGQLDLKSLHRFVHVSSFSVYDYAAVGLHGLLTEATPIDPKPEKRDAYTITKIQQERLVISSCEASRTHLVIIRPGVILGPGKDWGFGRVMKVGRFDVIFSPGAKVPLTYVSNCADAIVKALDAEVPSGSVYNIVDDELPSFSRLHRLGRRLGGKGVGPGLHVPWFGVRLLGAAVALANRLAFGGKAKLPEFLDGRRQRVRWQPMRFSNRAARENLRWSPAIALESAISRAAQGGGEALDVKGNKSQTEQVFQGA